MHIRISLSIKFHLKLTMLNFWTKFAREGYFPSKMKKVNTTIELYIYELVSVSNFGLHWQFQFFGPHFPKKGIAALKQKKVNTATEFCIFEKTESPLEFWTKFAQKGYFRSKTDKVNTTIEFHIFELVEMQIST